MGKKNSVIKNIMVTLGCTAFAGLYVVGGGYAVSTLMGGEDGARPAWMDRVEIHVGENASQSASAGASMKYSGNNQRQNWNQRQKVSLRKMKQMKQTNQIQRTTRRRKGISSR